MISLTDISASATRLCIGTLFLAALSVHAAAESNHPYGLHENHPYGVLSKAYETPHVKWADPYHQGPIRTLVLAPMWTQRETVELAQRLSLEFTPWMCSSYFEVAPAYLEHEARYFSPPASLLYEDLETFLSPNATYDVIVIGKLHWGMLPPERRFDLLKKVADGTGLVFVNPPVIDEELEVVFNKHPTHDHAVILEAVPLEALPRLRNLPPERLIRTSRFGSGRVVRITYDEPPMVSQDEHAYDGLNFLHSLTPRWIDPDYRSRWTIDHEPQFEVFYYDYYQSLLARTVLWAAGKEPAVRVTELSTEPEMDRESLPKTPIRLILDQGTSALATVYVKLQVRNVRGEVLAGQETVLEFGDTGTATADIALPELPAGTAFADIWIKEAKGGDTLNWGSLAFEVKADIAILDLHPARGSFNRGDLIAGSLSTSRPLSEGEHLEVSLWDSLGRELARAHPNLHGNSADFTLGAADPLAILHEFRVVVKQADRIVTESRSAFPVRKGSDPYDFNSILWSTPKNDIINHYMLLKLGAADEGDAIDVSWRGHLLNNTPPKGVDLDRMFAREVELENKVFNLARANLQIMGYNYRFGVLGGDQHHRLKGPCFTDPEWLAAIDEAFTKDAQVYGPFGPIGWTHGDESFLSEDPDVCWSPSCLAGFRAYLQDRYGDLESLSNRWGSRWTTWDDILPGTFEEARRSGNYPPWVDHKQFMNTAFAGLYDRAGQALATGDAGARTGFDGPKGFWLPNGGIDWWQLCKTRGVLQAYNESGELEVFRSFAHPNSLRGAWYGSYGDNYSRPTGVKASHYIVWNLLFNQANSSWFWTMGAPGPLSGYAPDLTSLPYFASRTRALQEIKSGIGKMILSSRRENDGIAIHFSDTSRIVDSLVSEKPSDWSTVFVSNLRYYRYLLEANGLGYDFVSYEQVEAGKLTRDGFRILVLPYSRAMSREEAEQIRRFVYAGGVVIADVMPGIFDEHGGSLPTPFLADLFPDADASQGALPLDLPTPHTYGKGKTIRVGDRSRGCEISVYGFTRDFEARLGPHIEAFRQILDAFTPIRGPVTVTALSEADSIPPTVIRRFTNADVEVVTLLRYYFADNHEPYPCRIGFDRTSHLYDVRRGRYLGRVDSVETVMSHTAHVYAMLPYRVRDVKVEPHTRICRGGEPISVEISIDAGEAETRAMRHCVRLRIIGPGENEVSHYAKNIMTEGGECTATMQFALNDPPGEYRFVGRDVLTGVEGSGTIQLVSK